MAVVASGSVADRPFGRTVATVAQRRFTGELRLTAAGQVWAIGWRDGYVVTATGSHPADSAIKTAMGAGLITSTQASAVLRSVSAGVDDIGLVAELTRLGPDNVARLRRRVVANRAMRLFAFDQGEFALDDELSLAVADDMVAIDPRVIIYQGVRNHFDSERLQRELAALGDNFRLRDDTSSEALASFGFGEAEEASLAVLRKRPLGASALIQAAPHVEPRTAHAALYALAVCGYVEVSGGRGQRPSMPPTHTSSSTRSAVIAAPTTTAAPGSAPGNNSLAKTASGRVPRLSVRMASLKAGAGINIEQIRALVAARMAAVEAGADHYELLGVTQDTPPEKIRSAYFEVARQLHPDRITASGLDDIRNDAQRLFAQINAAFGVLSHPKKRGEYLMTLRAGGEAVVRRKEEEAEQLAIKLLAAEDHFRSGEMALRRQQLDSAIAEFTKALELNPEEAEHHALLAWAQWCVAPDKVAAAKVARVGLDKATQLSPKNPVPHLLLGKLARSINEDEVALTHFKRVLEVSPSHGEATSEMRVVEARLTQKASTKPAADDKKPGGIFGRFKR